MSKSIGYFISNKYNSLKKIKLVAVILNLFDIKGWDIPQNLFLVFYPMYLLLSTFHLVTFVFMLNKLVPLFLLIPIKHLIFFSLINCDVWGLIMLQLIVGINFFYHFK